jgi:hypothetical protein
MNTALSAIQARVSSEEPDGILESFVAGPMTLTLLNPDAFSRSYMSSSYEGRVDVGPVLFSATVARNNVVVHIFVGGNDNTSSYASEHIDIPAWSGYEDEKEGVEANPPPYGKIKQFISGIISRTMASLPKFAALRSVKSIGDNRVELSYGDYTRDLDRMAAIGWKLVDYPQVEIGFDALSDNLDVYVRHRHLQDLPVDIAKQTPAAIIESIAKYLNNLGFPGDKRAEIDVILRDKRLNKGNRVLRYNVNDYRTALEQLKAVLERHKVSASLQHGAPQ